MKIDRTNYEAYLIDYLEGNLKDDECQIVEDFLSQNPDIQEELEGLSEVTLFTDDVVFSEKNTLKKGFDDEEVNDEYCIAYMEGDLDPIENVRFESHLKKSNDTQRNLALFEKTKIVADGNVVFANKKRLKKYSVFYYASRSVAAAAVIAMVAVGINSLEETQPVIPVKKPVLAQLDQVKPKSVEKISIPKVDVSIVQKVTKAPKIVIPVEEKVVKTERRQLEPLAMLSMRESKGVDMAQVNAIALQEVDVKAIKVSEERVLTLTEYLAQELLSKENNKFSLKGVVRTGVSIISSVTGNKLKYNEDEEGRVVALSMDTKLLGFNLPLSKKN
ncbi:hypothetical protein EMN47_07505 [Prolixibacteraceae bacterium JC049]|nr:hypothetical protein [Prolixibacteraceae bacterium JC049]